MTTDLLTSRSSRKNRPSGRSGFTLIEIVIYTVFFAAFSAIIVESIIATTQSFARLRLARDMNDTAIEAMERVTREVKWAQSVNTSSSLFGTTSGRIYLNSTNASGTPVTVDIRTQNSDLRLYQNGADQGSLVSGKARVKAFVLYSILAGSTSAIKIELTLASGNGPVTREEVFYNTAILRDSY